MLERNMAIGKLHLDSFQAVQEIETNGLLQKVNVTNVDEPVPEQNNKKCEK